MYVHLHCLLFKYPISGIGFRSFRSFAPVHENICRRRMSDCVIYWINILKRVLLNPGFIYRIICLIQFHGAIEILEITNLVMIFKCDHNAVFWGTKWKTIWSQYQWTKRSFFIFSISLWMCHSVFFSIWIILD